MKGILYLLLLVALVGNVVANINPDRRLPQPPVNLPQSANRMGWLVPWALVMPRFFAPSWLPVERKYSAPPQVDPIPPVCGLSCHLRPVLGVAQ